VVLYKQVSRYIYKAHNVGEKLAESEVTS